MIHKAIGSKDFLDSVSEALEQSGKKNRFCTIKSTTEKKLKDGRVIKKISEAQFEIGSSYTNRMKKPKRQGKGFKPKRKPYYSDYNENGTVRELVSNPAKKYICVWKSKIKSLSETYVDMNGNILDKKDVDVLLPDGQVDSPRYFGIDNVWYVSANGQTIVTEDYEDFKDFIDNI